MTKSEGVGTNVVSTDGDTGAVGLVDDTVNQLEVVRVRDHLVAGDNILTFESATVLEMK